MAITKGPLCGIRILDMSQAHAGPFGTMLLGDLGAEIIKIESPLGDILRYGEKEVNPINYYVLTLNRNKKGIVLDLGSEKGKKAFYDLVKKSDVVFSNFRADVPKRQGSDFETLKEINPNIIRCNISGYGPTGPYVKYPSFDIIACGHSGILSLSGEPDRPPVIPGGIAMADMMGGIFAVLSILAALISRDKDGKGVKAEVNLLDSLILMQKVLFQNYFASGNLPGLQGRRHHMMQTYGVHDTKDGYMTIGPGSEDKLVELVGLDWMFKDPKFDNMMNRILNAEEFREHFANALKKKNTDEWVNIFRDENDIPSGPVLSYEQVANDPQVEHNNMIIEMEIKGQKYKTIGPVFKMENELEGDPEPAPDLGQHTKEVLMDILNYSDEQIQQVEAENEAGVERLMNRNLKRVKR
ncbi:MAG: CoA transferase [Spirochaetota bacterium]|nr:CoA transferase [Spirochaetota bacterium]